MKCHIKALGLTCGVMCGGILFVMTLWATIFSDQTNVLLSSLRSFYFGYVIGFRGSVIGLIYGALTGFILGSLFGFLYNSFIDLFDHFKMRNI